MDNKITNVINNDKENELKAFDYALELVDAVKRIKPEKRQSALCALKREFADNAEMLDLLEIVFTLY